jgi:hypothetical protein
MVSGNSNAPARDTHHCAAFMFENGFKEFDAAAWSNEASMGVKGCYRDRAEDINRHASKHSIGPRRTLFHLTDEQSSRWSTMLKLWIPWSLGVDGSAEQIVSFRQPERLCRHICSFKVMFLEPTQV